MTVGVSVSASSSERDRAFAALFEAENAYVCRTLRRLGVAPADLEDLAHEVFVTVYRKLDQYDPDRPLRPWLFGITFRVAAKFRRLARHEHEVFGAELEAKADERALPRLEAREIVLQALACLSLEQRAVFVVHELDGEAIPEIARELEIPLNTAYSRLRAARKTFKQSVERIEQLRGEA